jgi:hypothetical protein
VAHPPTPRSRELDPVRITCSSFTVPGTINPDAISRLGTETLGGPLRGNYGHFFFFEFWSFIGNSICFGRETRSLQLCRCSCSHHSWKRVQSPFTWLTRKSGLGFSCVLGRLCAPPRILSSDFSAYAEKDLGCSYFLFCRFAHRPAENKCVSPSPRTTVLNKVTDSVI